VSIKVTSGRNHQLYVYDNDTVATLCHQAGELITTSGDDIDLLYGEPPRPLDDRSATLADCGVGHGAAVHLVVRTPGGQ